MHIDRKAERHEVRELMVGDRWAAWADRMHGWGGGRLYPGPRSATVTRYYL